MIKWTPALDHLVAGIVMGADWVASGAFEDIAQAYRDAGTWDRQDRRLLEGLRLRPLQQAIGGVALDERLVIVEDGTGSGKTEAALVHAERLAAAKLISGIYFAVPTRSAATELHARISRYLDAVPGLRGTVTRVVPGQIDTDGWQGRRPWHLGGSRQAMMARVAVGTIDQAMLSVMAVRHGWMRAAWLADRLLVIDEVHASDPYMEAVVGSLVRRHLDLGGYVLCLSATLGESMRSRLLGHPPAPPADAQRIPYPVIWAGSTPVPADPVTRRDVQIEMTDSPIEDAMRAAADGAAVLIIRSTVRDAVETWESLRALGVTPLLHHSRWADEDRRYLDAEVLRRIGRDGRISGSIVVGTQTLEQSLDIDADLLITDACPADVLLQRLGRLHRHDRERPAGYEQPRALLVDPGDMAQYVSRDGRVSGRQGQGWAWVYPVLSVAATVEWIREHGRIRVPEDSRALVERATHPDHLQEVAERLGVGWQRLMADTYGSGVAERQQGGLAVVDWSVPYQRAQVDSHPTRLGDGTVTIETPDLRSPLTGRKVAALPVPARWLDGVDEDTPATVAGQVVTIGALTMRYGEQGLQRL